MNLGTSQLTGGPLRRGGRMQSAWDRIAASDPGLQRLGTAARTTLGVAAAVGAAELAVRFAHAPFTIEILAAIIAEISSISVRDADAKTRRSTTALLPLPASGALVLGALIGHDRIVSDVAFLAIMFGAVVLRGSGPRASALGTLAFFGYFFSIFLGATLAQLPWSIAAICAGTACTFILRFIIFPDRPQQIVRRAVATFRARERAVLDALPAALEANNWDDRPRRRLRRKINLLKDAALAIEDRLGESGNFSDAEKTTLRLTLFDAELSTENLVSRALAAVHAQPDRGLQIVAAIDSLRRGLPRAATANGGGRRLPTGALRAIRAAAVAMDGIEAQQSPANIPKPPKSPQTRRPARPRRSGGFAQRLTPATRQAIQVTLASTLALVCGEFLSPQRWYWAVLAAFVVFSGAQSSGETRVRAVSRSLGTALGIVGGLAIVFVVGHDHTLQLFLLFIFMFGAMYFFGASYGIFVFFITALLALLYLILGMFSPSLLLLRLIETAIGSTIGVLVATFVLPTSTREALGSSAAALLGTLATVIERSAKRLGEPAEDDDDPAADARDLDRALTDILARARPLGAGRLSGTGRSAVRHRLLVLNACARYARNLARIARRARVAPPEAVREPLRSLGDTIASNIRAQADELSGKDAAPPVDIEPRVMELRRALGETDNATHDEVDAAVRELTRIVRALVQLNGEQTET